jgi:ATP-dependent RNA helicase DeaD
MGFEEPTPIQVSAIPSVLNGGYEKAEAKDGMVRLFMTIGRKDKIKVPDIVKSIAAEANIPHSKIGNIDVFDKFTFVEVPEDLADRVIRSVDDMVMKGRKVRVQKAKARTN